MLGKARGLDNLLYSSDVFFSCFADLALVSPVEYYKAGEGSLMQVVITPAQVSVWQMRSVRGTYPYPARRVL